MPSPVPPSRPIVLRADRETLVLLAAAAGLTVAIGYSVHSRPAAAPAERGAGTSAAAGQWAGQLAELQPAAAPTEPLSSAALTVPKAAMALPSVPRPATASARQKTCEGAACQTAKPSLAAAAPAPRLRPTPHPRGTIREASLVERLNPLNHLPDAVKRPFASAGDTIAGWVRRF